MVSSPIEKSRKSGKLKKVTALALSAFVLVGVSLFAATNQAKAAACTAPSADYGTATSTVKIDNATTYKVWSRLYAPDTTNNSYLLEVDGNSCFVVGDGGINPGAWSWVDYQNGAASSKISMALTAGNHTLKMIGREPGVKLGRVLLVSDANCTPVDNGDNCTVVQDTTAPVATLTNPVAGATVSGTLNVAATATDDTAVSKVEFYVNGNVVATSTAAPYTYAWDTTKAANGSNSVTVKAYDAAGNVGSDAAQVTVNNIAPDDKQAPTVPGNVTAAASAYNNVTVKWAASTDNVGVKGYIVTRNNVTVGNITSGTQYVDKTTLPSTTYGYQVIAYDAAGNNSTASTAATVTTPSAPDTEAPSVPGGVTASAAGTTQINVSWTASTDNTGVKAYDVYRATSGGTATKVATVTTTSYGDTNLKADTSYSYYVTASDAVGNTSAKSATVTAKTDAATTPPHSKKGGLKGHITYDKKNWWNRPVVFMEVNGHTRSDVTDSKGNYHIGRLPEGSYSVKYVALGAHTQTATVKITADKVTTQNITLR